MLQDVKNVLTFRAFKPEPDDRLATWPRRFPRERTLLLNIGRGFTSWKGLGRNGKFVDGGSQTGEFKEIVPALAAEWRGLTDEGWCAVSLNTRYVISLETNVSRKPGTEVLLRTNPRAVLGGRYERGKRYALTNNPESVATVLLSVEEEQIKQIETTLRDAALRVGRIACGSYAMLRRMLEAVHGGATRDETKGGGGEQHSMALYVVCCEGSVCTMLESGDAWAELRSRSDLYKDDDFEPIFHILQPLIPRLGRGGRVHFIADHADSPILAGLREQLPGAEVTDHSGEDQLWRVLAKS